MSWYPKLYQLKCDYASTTVWCKLYRYAAAPQELRTDWNKFTKDYFQSRSTLVSVFLLVDASIPAKKIDLEYASWLGENQVFFHVFYIQHWGKKIFKGIWNEATLDTWALASIYSGFQKNCHVMVLWAVVAQPFHLLPIFHHVWLGDISELRKTEKACSGTESPEWFLVGTNEFSHFKHDKNFIESFALAWVSLFWASQPNIILEQRWCFP